MFNCKGFMRRKFFKGKKLKGYSLLEIMAYVVIALLFAYGGINVIVSTIEKSKVSLLRSDFAALDSTLLQMMYEYSGMGLGQVDTDDFGNILNQYVDSIHNMKEWDEGSGVMAKTDPWNIQYKVTFTQMSKAESTILVESWGKKTVLPSYALLVHYLNGELRSGTAGFVGDSGAETSDLSIDPDTGEVTLTNMWAKDPS